MRPLSLPKARQKVDGGLPQVNELGHQAFYRASIEFGQAHELILVESWQISRSAAREPECTKSEDSLRIDKVPQQLLDAPLVGPVPILTFSIGQTTTKLGQLLGLALQVSNEVALDHPVDIG